MNNILFDIMQNADIGYSSTASKEAYKRYFAQKAANINIDIGVRFDGKGLEQQIIQAFENTGATVVL